MAKEPLKDLIDNEWLYQCPKAFSLIPKIGENIAYRALECMATISPDRPTVFRAFNECLPYNLKVILIGRSPFCNGNGLAFDSPKTAPEAATLKLLREVYLANKRSSQAMSLSQESFLQHLPSQGVLLLNYSLTCFKENDISHVKYWGSFTRTLIKEIDDHMNNIMFVVMDSSIKIEDLVKRNRLEKYSYNTGYHLWAEIQREYKIRI